MLICSGYPGLSVNPRWPHWCWLTYQPAWYCQSSLVMKYLCLVQHSLVQTGDRFNIKMLSYQYRNTYSKDKDLFVFTMGIPMSGKIVLIFYRSPARRSDSELPLYQWLDWMAIIHLVLFVMWSHPWLDKAGTNNSEVSLLSPGIYFLFVPINTVDIFAFMVIYMSPNNQVIVAWLELMNSVICVWFNTLCNKKRWRWHAHECRLYDLKFSCYQSFS